MVLFFSQQLTGEEVDRRKRRRERNKIAAAKCRNKKKEKTDCLQKVEFCYSHKTYYNISGNLFSIEPFSLDTKIKLRVISS